MGLETLMLAGGALSAVGQGVGAFSQYQAANYQAEVARQNAEIARQNQDRILQYESVQEGREGQKLAAQAGAIKAHQAASGVDVNRGSAVDVQAGQAELGTEDVLSIRNQANDAWRQAKLQEIQSQDSAKLYTSQATGSLVGGALSMGGSVLGTTAKYNKTFNSDWTAV